MGIDPEKLKKLYKIALAYQKRCQDGLAGQAFTNFTCLMCDQEWSHPNTNTPIFCDPCARDIRSNE